MAEASDRATAAALTRELMSGADRPTAILCASDTQALGAIEAIRSLGAEVPGDVSVVGYDDIVQAGDLGLTTVRQPLEESGRRAIERLLAAIDGGDASTDREVLAVELIIRGTTGLARV